MGLQGKRGVEWGLQGKRGAGWGWGHSGKRVGQGGDRVGEEWGWVIISRYHM